MLKFTDNIFCRMPDPEGDAIAAVIAEIDRYAEVLRSRRAGLGSFEAATVSEKLREARQYQVTPLDASAPSLASEAANRGIQTNALVAMVMAKASKARAEEAEIAGIAGKHKDAVKALRDREAVLEYDWRAGWPG